MVVVGTRHPEELQNRIDGKHLAILWMFWRRDTFESQVLSFFGDNDCHGKCNASQKERKSIAQS